MGESKGVLLNTEFKGKCHTCGKYGHKQNKCPEKNKVKEEKGYKKFTGNCNHCGILGHKAASCWELEANKDKRIKNWKKKKEKEVGALNVEVLLGCTKVCTINYENSKDLFKIDPWGLALHKLEEIPIPSNPCDNNENGTGNVW